MRRPVIALVAVFTLGILGILALAWAIPSGIATTSCPCRCCPDPCSCTDCPCIYLCDCEKGCTECECCLERK